MTRRGGKYGLQSKQKSPNVQTTPLGQVFESCHAPQQLESSSWICWKAELELELDDRNFQKQRCAMWMDCWIRSHSQYIAKKKKNKTVIIPKANPKPVLRRGGLFKSYSKMLWNGSTNARSCDLSARRRVSMRRLVLLLRCWQGWCTGTNLGDVSAEGPERDWKSHG